MAQHYGLLISPCRPRTPRHKGKVESGVHYVKRNFFAAEEFTDLAHVNRAGLTWVKEVAGTRVHGTTQEAPLARFLQHEQALLLPLPTEPFALVSAHRLTLHADCHLLLEGSHYSAPYTLIGKVLEVMLSQNSVQIFEGVNLLATHPRAQKPGERHTHAHHYPPGKAQWLLHTPERSREQALLVGPACQEVVEQLLALRPVDNRQAAGKVVALREKVGDARLEAACARALRFGDGRYRRIKTILASGLDSEPDAAPIPIVEQRVFTHARSLTELFWEGMPTC